METAGDARSARRLRTGITVGAIGISVILLRSAASAGDLASPDPVLPDIELAPAVVVAAGADSIDTNAVSQLYGYTDSGVQSGTAFRLADGRIVTVAHGVRDAIGLGLAGPDGQMELRRVSSDQPVPDWLVDVETVEISSDSGVDLAVIVDDSLIPWAGLAIGDAEPNVGDSIAAAGFDHEGRMRLESGVIVSRTAGSNYAMSLPDVFGIDIDSQPGWSGGPVVNADGEVIAVLVGIEQVSGIAIAVPIEFLP